MSGRTRLGPQQNNAMFRDDSEQTTTHDQCQYWSYSDWTYRFAVLTRIVVVCHRNTNHGRPHAASSTADSTGKRASHKQGDSEPALCTIPAAPPAPYPTTLVSLASGELQAQCWRKSDPHKHQGDIEKSDHSGQPCQRVGLTVREYDGSGHSREALDCLATILQAKLFTLCFDNINKVQCKI